MNRVAVSLELNGSFFDSPHGLCNIHNKSSAFDMSRLMSLLCKDARFRQVIGTRIFRVRKVDSGNTKDYAWENTHRMLGMKGVFGGKTGITVNAGPCLSTVI